MDTLRTQKIRYLTKMYRQMKLPLKKYERIEFIDKMAKLISNEEPNKILQEVN